MAPTPAKRPGTTVLPTKERGLFARLIQEYETKKYKTGLKTADAILKKYPEHGETLCMKGLILASLDRRAEGLELAKQGVRYDLTSFISWHALGILNRIAKNYNESLKCYSQALRIEGGTNINLIRESAYLHLQLRDWPKVVEHRTSLLRMQPHLRMHWSGLAVALHLGGNVDDALRVLRLFKSVHRDIPNRSFEQSEIYLYNTFILHEAGRYQEALDFLESKSKDEVIDRKGADLLKGQCQLGLGEKEAAEKTFAALLEQNSEDRGYIYAWLQARGIAAQASTDDERRAAQTAFSELQTRFPTSRAARRLALVYLTGDAFREQADAYIRSDLRKGVPSIFNDVRTLYGDDAKRHTIQELVEAARLEWASEQEPPTSLLWALYFLAQHYSTIGDTERAIAFIDSARAHTPTLPEVHTTRARILKRAGSIVWACQVMEDARQLDGQDRSLNCKAVKYLLRAGKVDEARAKASLFTKPDVPDPVADLAEMQASWYLIEEARSWKHKGNYAMALKRYNQIDKIYTEIWDDQLDFHSYCTRKHTMRAYVNMVRFEDRLHSHPAYFAAATDAVRILLLLHDNPSLYKPEQNGSVNGGMTDEQRKEQKKQRKAELRAAEEAAKKAKAGGGNAPAKQEKKGDDEEVAAPPKDEDPDGTDALKAVQPLADAERFLGVLQRDAARRVETWLLTFEVALRDKNWLVATKAVAQAHKLDAENGDVFVALVKLQRALPSLDAAPEPVGKSIAAVLEPLIPLEGGGLEAYRASYVQRNARRGDALLAGARALLVIRDDQEGAKREVQAALTELAKQAAGAATTSEAPPADTGAPASAPRFTCSLPTLAAARDLFAEVAGNVPPFATICRVAFPHADTFKSDSQMAEEAHARHAEVAAWAPTTADGEPAAAAAASAAATKEGA